MDSKLSSTETTKSIPNAENVVRVAFKVTKYGEFKGDVTAIFPELEANKGNKQCFALFEGHGECSNDWIRTQTRNAKPNEYSATKAVLERDYGYKLEVINSIKY